MDIKQLEQIFNENADQQQAEKMAKYLKNQFEFIGLPKPIRGELEKEFIKSHRQDEIKDVMELAKELHMLPKREYMYTAQQLLIAVVKRLEYEQIKAIMELTLINSWWENTDGYCIVLKKWFKLNPDYIESFIDDYYQQENFWLRRMTLICQLGQRDEVNFPALKKTILSNIADDEFFIQKAIGWSLREYGKYNPEAVLTFIKENEDKFSKLAYKEATKHLI